jgi:hypothetical protein
MPPPPETSPLGFVEKRALGFWHTARHSIIRLTIV